MGTVTSLTAAKINELAGEDVISGSVVGDDLILTKRNGGSINAGNVRGNSGSADVVAYDDALSNAGTVQVALDRQPRIRVHARDGLTGISTQMISKDAGDTLALPHILSIENDRLRITSDAALTYGNRRVAYQIDGTDGWVNSEIRSTWWGPSIMTTAAPTQPGHVHRCTPTGGVVFDQNVFGGFGQTWTAAWAWTGSSLSSISADVASPGSTSRELQIRGWKRIAGTTGTSYLEVDTIDNVSPGDEVTVTGTGVASIDGVHTVYLVVAGTTSILQNVGPTLIFQDSVNTTELAHASGTAVCQISQTTGINPKVIYPMHCASRLIGTHMWGKKWRVRTPEPPWITGSGYAYVSGSAWSSEMSAATPSIPVSGKCSVLMNHLYDGAYFEYSDIEVRQL